jgi:hypothetical protein
MSSVTFVANPTAMAIKLCKYVIIGLFFLLLCMDFSAMAQVKPSCITGRVVDENKAALPYLAVK